MSLATVYKTINLLKREGELLELEFSDLGNRYDGNKLYLHPHLIFGSNSEFRALAEVYGSADSQQQFVDDFVVAWNSSRQSVSSAKVLQALIFSDVFMQQVICWRSVVSVNNIVFYHTRGIIE